MLCLDAANRPGQWEQLQEALAALRSCLAESSNGDGHFDSDSGLHPWAEVVFRLWCFESLGFESVGQGCSLWIKQSRKFLYNRQADHHLCSC